MQVRSLTQSEMRNISEEKKELLENLTAVYAQGGRQTDSLILGYLFRILDLLVEHYQIRRNGMLEREVIQSIGFRNTVEDGKVTGFQFRVRLPYYRGIFLCQLRPGSLILDGKKFEKEEILWSIGGKDRTAEEMDPDKEPPFIMPEFGHHLHSRRLLIV